MVLELFILRICSGRMLNIMTANGFSLAFLTRSGVDLKTDLGTIDLPLSFLCSSLLQLGYLSHTRACPRFLKLCMLFSLKKNNGLMLS